MSKSNFSNIPYQNRAFFSECLYTWCMNEKGEHGKIIDWKDTLYSGERQFLVRWYEEDSLLKSYWESVIEESRLIPLDVSKSSDWKSQVQQKKLEFESLEEKKRLNQTLQTSNLKEITENKNSKRI